MRSIQSATGPALRRLSRVHQVGLLHLVQRPCFQCDGEGVHLPRRGSAMSRPSGSGRVSASR
jgi:hypothetical protein